jgi:hypothetical protein
MLPDTLLAAVEDDVEHLKLRPGGADQAIAFHERELFLRGHCDRNVSVEKECSR